MGGSEFQIFFFSEALLLLCVFVGDVWEPVTQEHQASWGVMTLNNGQQCLSLRQWPS